MNNYFQHIAKRENELLLEAEEKYGEYFSHILDCCSLLINFIKRIKGSSAYFSMFLNQFKKHLLLAILSITRRHDIQSMLDFRYAIESGCCAGYALNHDKEENFVKKKQDGSICVPDDFRKKVFDWMNLKDSKFSNFVKKTRKEYIDQVFSHANSICAFNNFSFSRKGEMTMYHFSFLDQEESGLIEGRLLMFANVTIGFMKFFLKLNKEFKIMDFCDDFSEKIVSLEKKNTDLLNTLSVGVPS